MISLICVWINDWVNNREAGDLRRFRAHYDVILMKKEQHVSRKVAEALFTVKDIKISVCTEYFMCNIWGYPYIIITHTDMFSSLIKKIVPAFF